MGYFDKLRTEFQFNRGVRCAEDGDVQSALTIFQQVIARAPDHALAHSNAGFCLFRLGKTDDAIKAYEKARSLAPEDPQHAYDMACVLYAAGKKDKAFDLVIDALKSDADHKESRVLLETLRSELKVPENDPRLKAVAIHTPAKPAPAEKPAAPPKPAAAEKPAVTPKNQPEIIAALMDKGDEFYERKEFEAALNSWTKAAQLDPNNAKAHNNRAAALFELGRHQEAIEACSEALRVQPGYAIAHMTRGEIYAAMGNRDAVMREYMALNTIDEELAQELIGLYRSLKDQPE